jgi:7,8-dihydropterin-6-yl-methyl-4-(beta-D-ribofuranosyl)aminobenzene 5'-phosphate synthase
MPTRIICVVENSAKEGTALCSEHGLSFWIETDNGKMLFDTGQTCSVFSHNLKSLGISPTDISTLALSHAHYDHTGGLDVLLSGKRDLDIFANNDIFRPRYALRKGEYQFIGMAVNQSQFAPSVKFHLSDSPVQIFPDLWTTGKIDLRPEPEGSSDHLLIADDLGWLPDPYLDDMSLVLKTSLGLVLICGCCHAGFLNTLFHVERTFGTPIIAVVGGVHLISADDLYLDHVVRIVDQHFQSLSFYINHCSGPKTIAKFKAVFRDRMNTCPAGTIINFD